MTALNYLIALNRTPEAADLADVKELEAIRRQKEIVGMAGKLEAAASGEERTKLPQRNVQTRHDVNFG